MKRNKPTSSGGMRGQPPGGASGHDEGWANLSDSDLVELDEVGEEVGHEIAPPKAPAGRPPRTSIPDLPAPVGPTPTRSSGKPGAPAGLVDLPAPVGPVPRKSIPDLLAPVGPRPSRSSRSPHGPAEAPAAAVASAAAESATAAPAGHSRTALPDEIDLPIPVGPIPTKGLPDLLTPVGPTPSRSSPDLPAPKGFFDDGVQPKPNAGLELPAPKGFFDDGIQPSLAGPRGAGRHGPLDLDMFQLGDDPAAEQAPPHPVGGEPVMHRSAEQSQPHGLDLGGPASLAGVNRPFGLDAAALDLERADEPTPPPIPLELNDAPFSSPTGAPVPRSRTSRLELELGEDGPLPPPGPPPAKAPPLGVTFGKAGPAGADRGRPAPETSDPFAPSRAAGHMLTTEIKLEMAPMPGSGGPPIPATVVAKRAAARTAEVARRPPRSAGEGQRRVTLVLAGALGATVLGAALYFGWGWWESYKARDLRAATGLRQVEKLLGEDSPSHWEQAASEARQIRGSEGENLEALAVVAEASFAAALDESPHAIERVKEGDQTLAALRARSAKGPHANKAEALRAILSTNFEQAVKRLQELTRTAAPDRDTQLYLGWALAAKEQHGKAVAAFTAALPRGKPRIPALYGLALSQLDLGDKAAAAKSFEGVIDASRDRFRRDHLGALIGLAQLAPVNERESRYQELLARPDLATASPRAVSRLRALAGDEALRAGRLEQARARYGEARALDPINLRASVGLALVAARGGDLAGARKKLIADVLEAAPDHIEGALALIEVALAAKQRDEAAALVESLFARRPPIANTTLLGRAFLARARVYESASEPALQAKAEAEYREAIARADPGDFAATVGLSSLLMRLGRKQEALDVLGPVKSAAKGDPGLALTLGSAYLAAGQADEAAEAFRSVLARRPDDAEAHFQLGNAYLASGKLSDALQSLHKAYALDPSREDIGLGLARTLEANDRTRDALATYQKMLSGEHKPSLTVRSQAGRAYARLGMAAEAAAQGDAIRQEDPENPAGQFLLGEKLYGEGNYEAARKAYREATRTESDAQYLDALGRVSEKLGQADDALHYFGDAIAADPRYLAPRVGRGRVRLARREYALAVSELSAAQKVASDEPTVLRDLGRAYQAMRDLPHAVPLLERAEELDGHDPLTQYALGCVYYDIDRPGLAAQHLTRAVEHAPADAVWRGEAFRLLGYAQRAAGNRSGAASAWQRYLDAERADGPERRDVQRLLLRLEAK